MRGLPLAEARRGHHEVGLEVIFLMAWRAAVRAMPGRYDGESARMRALIVNTPRGEIEISALSNSRYIW